MPDELDVLIEKVDEVIDSVVGGTLVSVVLDRSGSMSGVAVDTIKGFNKLIEDQKQQPGKCWVSLTLFDTEVEIIYTGLPIEQVPLLTQDVYNCRGMTALLDAQGLTVEATEKHLDSLDIKDRPSSVLFVTMTDGGENSSREYTQETLKKTISQKQEGDGWDFVYTGANQDSFGVAKSLGYAPSMVVNYAASQAGETLTALSSSVSMYRGMNDTQRSSLRSAKASAFWKDDEEEE